MERRIQLCVFAELFFCVIGNFVPMTQKCSAIYRIAKRYDETKLPSVRRTLSITQSVMHNAA